MLEASRCPQCTAPVPDSADRCEYCASYFKISRLDQLNMASEDALRFCIKDYQGILQSDPESGQAFLSLGLCFLRLGLHKEALENLQKACDLIPASPELYYYISVAALNGKRPRLAKLQDIKKIESYLEAGLKIDSDNAILLYLRSIIKEDYYKAHGLKESPSSGYFYKKARKHGLTEEQMDNTLKLIGLSRDLIETPEEKQQREKIDKKKRLRIQLYFLPPIFWFVAVAFIFLGIGGIIMNLKYHEPISSFLILTILAITITVYLALKRANTAMIDRYFIEDLEMLKNKKAIDKLGIDPRQLVRENAIAYGPVIEGKGRTSVIDRKDKKVRYRKIQVFVAAFGTHQLLTYQCVFDFTTGKSTKETTDEFFYNDIVSASTGIGFWEYRVNGKVISDKEVEIFKLTTSAGTDISIPIRSKYIKSSGDKAIALAGDTVQAIRCMLREKKAN